MTVPGVPGTWDRLRGTLQHIRLALPRFVKLSNWTAGEFDVSLAPYRKIRKTQYDRPAAGRRRRGAVPCSDFRPSCRRTFGDEDEFANPVTQP